jgi:hypothetical protein
MTTLPTDETEFDAEPFVPQTTSLGRLAAASQ